ncbi:hypothetical protein EAE32_10590 [Kocuria tytonicola]|uniref:Uncharacterized protein n=2 Tax=Kocuria tytonicola TaxID=2055946 RepID=A0A3L9KXU8_9MICC|nr:hypothetical protein [Kocuria tytonicola]RLY91666.1 hypothetical protein EAE32_10590 [Kocuria tytonicola]
MPRHSLAPTPRVETLRSELRGLGLPLVLEPRARLHGLLARSAPALMGVLTCLVGIDVFVLNMADVPPEQLAQPLDEDLLLAGVGILIMVCFPVTWWVLRLVLRHCSRTVGNVVGAVLLATVLLIPWLASPEDGISLGDVLIILGLLFLAMYWGVDTVLSWATRRAARELNHLGSMVGRVLPILMLALLFSFFNAEIWQVVAQLSVARTWAIVGVMGLLGIALATLNAKDEISQIIRTYDAQEGGTDLRPLERANITAMCVLISIIQVTLLGVVVFVFYVVFGVLSVSPVTATQWIGSPPARLDGILAALPVSLPLVQVCLVLSAFSALNFIVSIGTDTTYRATFLEPALDEVRKGLVARDEYTALRDGRTPPAPRGTEAPSTTHRPSGAASV